MMGILLIGPVAVLCYVSYKMGEVAHYKKMNKVLDKAYTESTTEQDIKRRIGWIDCILYIMEEAE